MKTPQFISIEGIEGAGKSTLIQHLGQWLSEQGVPFIKTREPGGCAISEAIRGVILRPYEQAMAPECELLLLMAARVQHLSQVILPSLAEGKWVICDRFRDATLAYQGGGRNIPIELILSLEAWYPPMRLPDKTIYLDLDPVESRKRQQERGQVRDRIEQELDPFFERVRQGYLKIARADPHRLVVIDAHQSPQAILAVIQEVLSPYV